MILIDKLDYEMSSMYVVHRSATVSWMVRQIVDDFYLMQNLYAKCICAI